MRSSESFHFAKNFSCLLHFCYYANEYFITIDAALKRMLNVCTILKSVKNWASTENDGNKVAESDVKTVKTVNKMGKKERRQKTKQNFEHFRRLKRKSAQRRLSSPRMRLSFTVWTLFTTLACWFSVVVYIFRRIEIHFLHAKQQRSTEATRSTHCNLIECVRIEHFISSHSMMMNWHFSLRWYF